MSGPLDERARANAALRLAVQRLAATGAPDDELAEVAEQLEALNARLERYQSEHRYTDAAGNQLGMFTHPVTGEGNALAPPLLCVASEGRSVVTGTYTHAYEGPPGRLHGGYVAMGMDLALGRAVSSAGLTGFTGSLTVRYRKPTPMFVPVRYEAQVTGVDGRKVTVTATLVAEGELTAEAEGLWIVSA